MSFTFRTFKMGLLLLLVAAYAWGQRTDAKELSIRGTTQKSIQCVLEALDKILQEETNNTANKQIAPRRIENVTDSNCP